MTDRVSGKIIKSAAVVARAKSIKTHSTPVREALVVLAMHQTGSSAITRVLNLLGCDTAKTLIGSNEHDENGYWESDILRAFNDKLLASAGSNWRDWQAFDTGWYQTPQLAEHLECGRELLDAEFGTSKLFVFKDPRVIRIVPFWRQLLAEAGVKPRVILTLRHPVGVAASLCKRDGITEAEAALIWLRNMLDAELGSRGMVRVVVNYARLMVAPSATMAAIQKPLGLVWPRLSENVATEIDAFMSPSLRHYKVDAAAGFATDQPFRDWLTQVNAIFERWSETGEDEADRSALDAVREGMNTLATPLREVLASLTRQTTDMSALNKELAFLRGEAGNRGHALTMLTAEEKVLTEAYDTEKAAQAQAKTKTTALRAEQERAHLTQVAALQDDLRKVAAALADAQTAQQGLQGDLSDTQNTLRKQQHEAEQTAAALTSSRQELEMAQAELDRSRKALADERAALDGARRASEAAEVERYDEIAELTQTLMTRDTEISDRTAQLRAADAARAELSTAAETMKQELGCATATIHHLTQNLAARETALAEAHAERQGLEGTLWEAQSALRQRQLETEQTAAALTAAGQELEAAQARLDQATAAISGQTEKLAMRDAAIRRLVLLIEEGRALSEHVERTVNALLDQPEHAWVRGKRRIERKAALLKASNMFDTEWYMSAYPDVAESGQEAAVHFVLYGHDEGRQPLPHIAALQTAPREDVA